MLGTRRWYAIDWVTMPAASAIATVSAGLCTRSRSIGKSALRARERSTRGPSERRIFPSSVGPPCSDHVEPRHEDDPPHWDARLGSDEHWLSSCCGAAIRCEQLCLSFGFTSLGHRARLISVREPLDAAKAQPNPARCRVDSDAEGLMLALWCAIKVVRARPRIHQPIRKGAIRHGSPLLEVR